MCIDHVTGFKLEPKTVSNNSSNLQSPDEELSENNHMIECDRLSTSSRCNLSLIKCYNGPGHINEQRKFKRRCLGIHTYPVLFDR